MDERTSPLPDETRESDKPGEISEPVAPATETKPQRAVWITPKVRRLAVSDAENHVGVGADLILLAS